jgi:hypothetical protein
VLNEGSSDIVVTLQTFTAYSCLISRLQENHVCLLHTSTRLMSKMPLKSRGEIKLILFQPRRYSPRVQFIFPNYLSDS